ncbi:hypothetical protein DL771_002943 [Monosporascus sp. 5C6A]|nr:hypothetical protein DL771_002943 [Monosporascus sp. 5C6A]
MPHAPVHDDDVAGPALEGHQEARRVGWDLVPVHTPVRVGDVPGDAVLLADVREAPDGVPRLDVSLAFREDQGLV